MRAVMVEINADNFHDEVVNSDHPVVVDFWGPKCTMCMALMPAMEELAREYGDRIKFCKINIAKNRRLCIEYKVSPADYRLANLDSVMVYLAVRPPFLW